MFFEKEFIKLAFGNILDSKVSIFEIIFKIKSLCSFDELDLIFSLSILAY